MCNCILANTGACNRAIGLARALNAVEHDLIPAMQNVQPRGAIDTAAGLANNAAGHTGASGGESVSFGGARIGPLCNERTFTIGHGHAGNIGASRRTASEVSP